MNINNINKKKSFLDYKCLDINYKKIFGFWIYIMSDCIFFACLFAIYMVLNNNKINFFIKKEIFNLNSVLLETIILLTSAFTFGIAISKINSNNIKSLNNWLFLTFLLGLTFLIIEFNELNHFIKIHIGPNYNAYMSSFFSILFIHGAHVFFGLIWILITILQIKTDNLIPANKTRLICLSLFWHFLDIIWICVFTIIYFLGYLNK
ncbi:cytochrome o ubiquinol oxidase subunit III [Enterobacterales bacterium endosymbiont of Anomoneura mori]|uniref:cytochrome c oxidase subunit 3 n=1 Tax=Enterobacterales bacterium endosymbiont of Anomoneura mori TaxID=3132096 RepID=UPI00399D550E